MNCGLPLKVSGETDFPCMSGTRVGQGRSYVQLGKQTRVDYAQWCRGLARGRSYVSDGYAHALGVRRQRQDVGRRAPARHARQGDGEGDAWRFRRRRRSSRPTAARSPSAVAATSATPSSGGKRCRSTLLYQRGQRLVEVVVNGRAVASREVPADGREHALEFTVPIERSSWIALRQFPQLHTNPVIVLVGGKPIRASRESA